MEDSSLFSLLHELGFQHQTNDANNWLEPPASGLVGDNSIFANDTTSSPHIVDGSPDAQNGRKTTPENQFEDEFDANNNKRKRREIQNRSEAKRRMKFNEQLATLRTLLLRGDDESAESKKAAVTRESIMSSAIEEIMSLRKELAQIKDTSSILMRLGTGKFPMFQESSQTALSDPHNRSPYTIQDLERAFQTMFARELERFCQGAISRNDRSLHGLKMLKDVSKQIGKPEYQLNIGILEQMYHSFVKYNTKELRNILETNWSLYQAVKKNDKDNLLLFAESEIGAWILTHMSMLEFFTGNIDAADRTYGFAKQLTKRIRHRGTNRFLLANFASTMRGMLTVQTAQQIGKIVQDHLLWGPMGDIILGAALVASGQHEQGVNTLEKAISYLMEREGEPVMCVLPPLLEAYIKTGNVDKGLSCTNYILKYQQEYNIDGFMGKAEILRLRANLVMMKKYPDYVPEPISPNFVDSSIQDIIEISLNDLVTPEEKQQAATVSLYGPSVHSSILQACLAMSPDVEYDDVEMMLRSSMNLAQVKELFTIELRCAVDLTRYFMHIGDVMQAMETVYLVKNCMAKMKGPENSSELQRARYVLSLIDEEQ